MPPAMRYSSAHVQSSLNDTLTMNIQAVAFGTIGGLALFLFGMTFMAEGLEKAGSKSLKKLLHSLTRNRLSAILVGVGVTCIVQSSSATSVIVVGLVNAGLLLLEQAVAIVLGADIGTTITAWIVSTMGIGRMSITTYSLPLIATGFVLHFMARSHKKKMFGQTILGFGLLLLGLGTMSDGVKSIKDSPAIMVFFKECGPNPFFGIVAGTLVTCIIQSSSATIAIVQVMALQGIFGLETALPLLLGANIGTTITAQLAVIGGTKTARAVAMANTLFKTFGVILFIPLLMSGLFQQGIVAIVPDRIAQESGINSRIMFQIAVAHSMFMLISVALFSTILWPFLIFCARRAAFLDKVPAQPEGLRYLDPLLLKTPQIALEQAVREVAYMTRQCHKNIRASFDAFMEKNLQDAQKIAAREDQIDGLQTAITEFLVQLEGVELSVEESRSIPRLIHCINDAERIGDHAENLMELTQLMVMNHHELTPFAERDLRDYFALVERQFKATIEALETRNGAAVAEALAVEKQLNEDCARISRSHVERLEAGSCSVQAGVVFLDVIANLEKIGDHLSNIAERVEIGPSA